jgi:15-cis-phytoene synthase
MRRDLVAAGIADPDLQHAYDQCRRLNARYGKTYYLATLLLPPAKRPFVHALYGFARLADEIVDAFDGGGVEHRSAALAQLRNDLLSARRTGTSDHPVLAALVDTTDRWQIPDGHVDVFLESMQMDLTVAHYPTYADLQRYTYGSAAVIGLQMLPILEPSDRDAAAAGAADLGTSFQLANFIRDVGEDLDRGRIYLPLDELAEWGVTPQTLATRVVDDNLRHALAQQVDRVRELSASAARSIDLLHPSVRDCIRTARVLYCEIADRVAESGYDVFARRAGVPRTRRLAVAQSGWRHARRARRTYGSGVIPPRRLDPGRSGRPASVADR